MTRAKKSKKEKSHSWEILKFSQEMGFQVIDSPFDWPEGADEYKMYSLAGLDTVDEDATLSQLAYHSNTIIYRRNEKTDRGLTHIVGVIESTWILTDNAAEQLALRIKLAPLAQVMLTEAIADAQSIHGTLKNFREYENDIERGRKR